MFTARRPAARTSKDAYEHNKSFISNIFGIYRASNISRVQVGSVSSKLNLNIWKESEGFSFRVNTIKEANSYHSVQCKWKIMDLAQKQVDRNTIKLPVLLQFFSLLIYFIGPFCAIVF